MTTRLAKAKSSSNSMSHESMGVFWSSTDTEQMSQTFSGADWILSIVVNKKGEYVCRLDIHNPWHIIIDNIPLIDEVVMPEGLEDQLESEIRELVKRQTGYTVSTYMGQGYGQHVGGGPRPFRKNGELVVWDPARKDFVPYEEDEETEGIRKRICGAREVPSATQVVVPTGAGEDEEDILRRYNIGGGD